ncbi:hypothetical protein BCR33DRAFT_712804 [Rhizoclosmatium globosum]|uniref:J domain-containing protein n=1 Tax=Rhizoclosmatium globosum TaxID=329046 RepID=A0A1Y2CV37_9FUNG|nr:hypothetical protein BCR33DRAFT_712804 [Rhizoclosmatium globosum]|eukprot:ORY50827.1 hypothetical protein BCR33DRAFT_712804 [Rhizoclosmatium globosum]
MLGFGLSFDPYVELGVDRNVTPEDLKTAYRHACLRTDPDQFPAKERSLAQAKFRRHQQQQPSVTPSTTLTRPSNSKQPDSTSHSNNSTDVPSASHSDFPQTPPLQQPHHPTPLDDEEPPQPTCFITQKNFYEYYLTKQKAMYEKELFEQRAYYEQQIHAANQHIHAQVQEIQALRIREQQYFTQLTQAGGSGVGTVGQAYGFCAPQYYDTSNHASWFGVMSHQVQAGQQRQQGQLVDEVKREASCEKGENVGTMKE